MRVGPRRGWRSASPTRSRRCSPDGDAARAREIFVLTRTRRESEARRRRAGGARRPRCPLQSGGPLRDRRSAPRPRPAARDRRSARSGQAAARLADAVLRPRARRSARRGRAGGAEPLVHRLLDWHAAAERGEPLGRLYGRILDESGVLRRELFCGRAARRLTNYPAPVRGPARADAAAHRAAARRRRAPAGRAGRRAGGARSPRKGTSCASRAIATPSRS